MTLPPARTRYLCLLVLSICCSTAFAHPARAQSGIGLQTCEDLKIIKKQHGVLTVETAACLIPRKTFRPKGTQRNVHIPATFPAVPTGAKITFLATETDADGEDAVGARTAANTAAGQGKVSICKEIDDDWKCGGQSDRWAANAPSNVLFGTPPDGLMNTSNAGE